MTDKTELHAALAAFQNDMPTVAKTRVGRGYGDRDEYRYADLADVTAAARPVLAEHGLLVTYETRVRPDGGTTVTGRLIHVDSQQSIKATLPLHGRHPQEQGSAITYARRYLLGLLTGIITDEDDDGAAASTRRAGRPQAVEQVVNPQQRADALRDDLNAATTIEALSDIYTQHQLGSAPQDIRDLYHERVMAVRAEVTA